MVRSGIELTVGRNAVVDLVLEIGDDDGSRDGRR